MLMMVKNLPDDVKYPYPIHDWMDDKKYSSPHDYLIRPEKYLHKFFYRNKTYQISLEKYLSRKYRGDTYTPYFFLEDLPLHEQSIEIVLKGVSCRVSHDINIFWGWEFLRRNGDYQYLYDHYVSSELSEFEKLNCANKIVEGFGIKAVDTRLPNPRDSHPHYAHFMVLNPGVTISTFNNKIEHKRILEPRFEEEIVFRVNVGLPLPAQLEHIKTTMQAHAERKGYKNSQRPNNEEFKRFIRVLDAEYSGVEKEVIASEIYPYSDNTYGGGYSGNGAVSNALERGFQLAEKGYLRYFYHNEQFDHLKRKKHK